MAEEYIEKTEFTGAAAVAASVPATGRRRVVSVSAKLSAAPVSAASLTITLNAGAGATYDILLKTVAMVGVTSLLWQPDADLFMEGGDALDIAYTNPDGRTYGIQVTLEVV